MILHFVLNCTDKNPLERWGLRQNPFPQIAKNELDRAMVQLNSLGRPLRGPEDIAERLEGWGEEFITECQKRYAPGVFVHCTVTIPDAVLPPHLRGLSS